MMKHSKRIAVTGGGGFLGSFLVERLKQAGYDNVVAPRKVEFDFFDSAQVSRFYETVRPHIVIHLAAVVGGIGANRRHPGRLFYDNAIMGIQLIEQGRRFGLEKFVCAGTVCAYPKFTPVPFREADIWNGYPEETNAPYGLAKKMLLVQLQAYRQEYGFNGIYLIPVNLYGPRDNFDPQSSHVIPALIRKCVEAKRRNLPTITVWGTGAATREFLYVEDAAAAIVAAMEQYDRPAPMNLGSGQEMAIRELVMLIRELVGYTGDVVWDASQPDGQPRRCLDTSLATQELGWTAQTPFREGLQRTIDWYLAHSTQ
ncbi:MAG TPA: GDP-L-fucose synthase [Acidobacteriota bacterium]|nr:GDP-L-fucose synthase [Acidobacteriota bacterium]